MKKLIISLLLSISLFIPKIRIIAEDNIQLISGHATAYCISGITRSGEKTRYGICAMDEEYIGKTAIVYQRLPDGKIGKLIGIFDILDSGSGNGIQQGKVVDVWKPNIEECKEFMNLVYEDGCKGKVYIQIVDAEG